MSTVHRNAAGRRVGESHQWATLSDAEVEEVRHLRETRGMWYRELAVRFNVPWETIRAWCVYKRRPLKPELTAREE
jgi:DNA-binding transcriptional regulator YiaG